MMCCWTFLIPLLQLALIISYNYIIGSGWFDGTLMTIPDTIKILFVFNEKYHAFMYSQYHHVSMHAYSEHIVVCTTV